MTEERDFGKEAEELYRGWVECIDKSSAEAESYLEALSEDLAYIEWLCKQVEKK